MATATNPLLHSMYVTDLDPAVTEGQLIETFSKFGGFVSAVLHKNRITGRSLCYGYVNFDGPKSAMQAMTTLNHTLMNGKRIRIMRSQQDSEARMSGIGNVFVKNLDSSIANLKLHDIFSKYGDILSCKVVMTQDQKSKGYGFVQYTSAESAYKAIEKVNGCIIEGKQIHVGQFMKRNERIQADARYKNLCIKNLDQGVTEELLQERFSKFGNISSLVISKDSNGISKGLGFVSFENPDDAKQAKESMNGTKFGSKVLYVVRVQKKEEREQFLHLQYEERCKKYKGLNVYIKNINDDVDENQLKEHFSQCGTISSAMIMRNDRGINRGFGFVCFSTREEANKAIQTLNGVFFHQKPLYVAIAQTKEERRVFLQMLHTKDREGLPRPSGSIIGPRHPTSHYPLGFIPDWRPYGFKPPPVGPSFQPALLPMIPNSPRHYQVPFMPNLQGPNQFTEFHRDLAYQQRAGHPRYTTTRHPQEMNNRYDVPSSATSSSTTNASHESEDLSSRLAAAAQASLPSC